MSVEKFNALSDSAARELLRNCLAVRRWVEEVAAERPYPALASLFARAKASAENLTDEELDEALSRHPRIGEHAPHTGADADLSRTEQAGVDTADAAVAAQLEAGNREYEQRFGRVFIIRAAGRTGPQILTELQRRLDNNPVTERRETVAQLREIALLRLEHALTDLSEAEHAIAGSTSDNSV